MSLLALVGNKERFGDENVPNGDDSGKIENDENFRKILNEKLMEALK